MQSKGFIRTLAILFGLASIWQLSFTAVSKYQEKKSEEYAAAAIEQFKTTPLYEAVAEGDRAYFLD